MRKGFASCRQKDKWKNNNNAFGYKNEMRLEIKCWLSRRDGDAI